MSHWTRVVGLLGLAAAGASGRLLGQTLSNGNQLFAGAEARSLSFDGLPSLRRLRQFSFPVGGIVSFGRFQVDFGTSFVSTELLRVDSTHHSVDHLTDSQLRGSYVFGKDAIVATVALNLPTGPRNATPRDYTVLGAVSPSFLGFPVAAYANGFSATGGLAAAIPAGKWSFGLAGSLRVSSEFTPYEDTSGPVVYKPGVEGRIRGGADGLVGSSRVTAGLTYSTFGDDQFGTSGTLRGLYHPGPRWLAEGGLVAPLWSATLNASLWHFRRTSGDTTGASARNQENLTAAELSVSVPVNSSFAIEPEVSGRVSKPQSGLGHMVGIGTAIRIALSDHLTLSPTWRYDLGWVETGAGARNNLHGWYGSVFLRLGSR